MKVYVCNHREYMDFGEGPVVNDLVLHVASSKKKAEEYMKSLWCDPYSWWELTEYELDGSPMDDDYYTVGIYGNRGGKFRGDPMKKCLAAFLKCKADPAHHLNA
jgi:hypothetical protein